MTQLHAVHAGLLKVRHWRTLVRLGSAWSLFIASLLGALLANFVLDVWIHMGKLERGIMLAALLGLLGWVFGKFVRPALGVDEDDVSLALLVERNQGISSDLVAAMQFARGGVPHSGSPALRKAVVEYVAELAPSLNFLEGFPRKQLLQRLGLATALIVLWLGVLLLLPNHVLAFANRLFLGGATYPTRTRIVEMLRPGDRAPYGQPVVFEIRAAGVLPAAGRVEVRAAAGSATTSLVLEPDPQHPGHYLGRFERLLEEIDYAVYLGDAETPWQRLQLIPPPNVTIDAVVEIPAYARARFRGAEEGSKQRIALEGSRVIPVVTADKSLRTATLTLGGKAYPMRRANDRYVLDGTDSPLQQVAETVRFEVQVVDADGLSLERPAALSVQVRPDNPPRIAVGVVTRTVLPKATPNLRWQAVDDYGLAQVTLHVEVTRAGDAPTGADAVAPAATQPTAEVVRPVAQAEDHPLNLGATVSLDLSEFNLKKGDRVAVSLEARDWRGELPGKTTRSETIVFEVTDQEGVLEALKELDEQMTRRLDEIIKAQLGIGGQP